SFPDGGGAVETAPGDKLGKALDAMKTQWLREIEEKLRGFASLRALPRNIFLLADPDARAFFASALDVPIIRALWLSDEPLPIIALERKHFGVSITAGEAVPDDLPLALLALAAREKLPA